MDNIHSQTYGQKGRPWFPGRNQEVPPGRPDLPGIRDPYSYAFPERERAAV